MELAKMATIRSCIAKIGSNWKFAVGMISLIPFLVILLTDTLACQQREVLEVIKKIISTPNAPEAIGPYSQGVMVTGGSTLYCSGQIPLDPKTGLIISGTAADQTRRVMDNLKAVVEAGGYTMGDIVKTTIYLTDLANFTEVNNAYKEYFAGDYPARATVQVAALPKGALVEIDAIAVR